MALNKMVNTWLSEEGAPGQGKTFLSRFVLHHLNDQIAKTQEQDSIIYFFFYGQDEQF
jgi:Cdc6-like AAA superfamily ATPase